MADDLCLNEDGFGVMKQMARVYEKYRCPIIAVMEVPKDEVSKYGIIEGDVINSDLISISNMIEKPQPNEVSSNLAIIGRYILTPDIFDIIENTKPGKNGEVQITDALLTQSKNSMVLAYKFKGLRFDCGSIDGYVEATNYMYKKKFENV